MKFRRQHLREAEPASLFRRRVFQAMGRAFSKKGDKNKKRPVPRGGPNPSVDMPAATSRTEAGEKMDCSSQTDFNPSFYPPPPPVLRDKEVQTKVSSRNQESQTQVIRSCEKEVQTGRQLPLQKPQTRHSLGIQVQPTTSDKRLQIQLVPESRNRGTQVLSERVEFGCQAESLDICTTVTRQSLDALLQAVNQDTATDTPIKAIRADEECGAPRCEEDENDTINKESSIGVSALNVLPAPLEVQERPSGANPPIPSPIKDNESPLKAPPPSTEFVSSADDSDEEWIPVRHSKNLKRVGDRNAKGSLLSKAMPVAQSSGSRVADDPQQGRHKDKSPNRRPHENCRKAEALRTAQEELARKSFDLKSYEGFGKELRSEASSSKTSTQDFGLSFADWPELKTAAPTRKKSIVEEVRKEKTTVDELADKIKEFFAEEEEPASTPAPTPSTPAPSTSTADCQPPESPKRSEAVWSKQDPNNLEIYEEIRKMARASLAFIDVHAKCARAQNNEQVVKDCQAMRWGYVLQKNFCEEVLRNRRKNTIELVQRIPRPRPTSDFPAFNEFVAAQRQRRSK